MTTTKVTLRDKWGQIPLDAEGDPCFGDLPAARRVFTDEEITTLVNRQLTFQKYQRESHRKNYAAKRDGVERKPSGRPKGATNTLTTRQEAKELIQIAKREAIEHLEREDVAMREWIAKVKEENGL
jgi:hypothetical protein